MVLATATLGGRCSPVAVQLGSAQYIAMQLISLCMIRTSAHLLETRTPLQAAAACRAHQRCTCEQMYVSLQPPDCPWHGLHTGRFPPREEHRQEHCSIGQCAAAASGFVLRALQCACERHRYAPITGCNTFRLHHGPDCCIICEQQTPCAMLSTVTQGFASCQN